MAAYSPRSGGLDAFSSQPVRHSSVSSDNMSTSARSNAAALNVPTANPPPAYVARAEASDLLTTELGRTVDVSIPALTLLNEFLDHVLYIIICTSQSVGLGQLKTAIPVVLKPRLGKAALRVAEEELKDYIEDEEAEALYSRKTNPSDKNTSDLDLVWKLARLRCMVYARMGDLEEEDEEEWLEKEQLLDQAAALSTTARKSVAVTPGAAIFLTSVIEYLGEQALYYAAQHAQKRHDAANRVAETVRRSDSQSVGELSEIILDGKDMNHIGRDSPLSRLWRSWRRNTRSPVDTFSSPISPLEELSDSVDSIPGQTTARGIHQSTLPAAEQHHTSVSTILTPSRIPLPVSEHDFDEIDGRGYARNGADTAEQSRRRSSMPVFPAIVSGNVVPGYQERSPLRPSFGRHRSNSSPTRPSPQASSVEPSAFRRFNVDEIYDAPPIRKEQLTDLDRRTTSSPEQVNEAVGAIVGALGVVGVHHVRHLENLREPPAYATEETSTTSSQIPGQPLTSASIKGPGDFDMMYVPEVESSPEPVKFQRSTENILAQPSLKRSDPYSENAARQLEEHQRYSQQSHEMSTPSIYDNREHSPRFRQDVPATYAVEDASLKAESDTLRDRAVQESATTTARQTAYSDPQRGTMLDGSSPKQGNVVSSYAPATKPGQSDNKNGSMAALGEPDLPWQRQADSPVSQMSDKHSTKRLAPTNEPVPDLPPAFQQPAETFDPTAHMRGHSKSSSSSSRLLGFTRDTDGKPHSIYQQRAIGGMTDEIRRAHSATPDGRNGQQDQEYTPIPAKRPHLRVADSENSVARPLSNEYRTDRSLEVLINSDETLHYTLTPATANFRDEDINPYSRRTETQDLAEFFQNTAPPGQENTPLPSTRSRKTSMNAARAPQVLPVTRATASPSTDTGLQQAPRPKKRNPVGEPRDAKVDGMSSVRDLAEYARSTGPKNDDQLPKPLPSHLMTPSTNRPVEMAAPNSPSAPPSRPASKLSHRLKFQARDARPSRHAESTALIEFIREGPPRTSVNRHTAGSDDLSNSTVSQPKGSSDTNGFHSIAESQSPLLDRDGKSNAAVVRSPAQPKVQSEVNKSVPKKGRRKPRDPYEIDDTDDELDDRPTRQTNEESLIDFLRNTAPSTAVDTEQDANTPQKPAEPSSLGRANSFNRLTGIGRARRDSATSANPIKQTQSQARARAESPHLTQAGSKLDSYRPTQATHASHVDRNRTKSKTRNGVSRKESLPKYQSYGETADLADYLRNTGPTATQEGWTQPLVDRPANGVRGDGSGGLRKFFSMRGRK